MKTMLLNRLKPIGGVLVVMVGLLALGAGLRPRWALAEKPPAAQKPAPEEKGPAKGQADVLRQLEGVEWNLLRVEFAQRTLHIADVPAARAWKRGAAEQLFASTGAQLSLQELPVAKDARITLAG